MDIWYAVNQSGQGRIFFEQPQRNVQSGVWDGKTVGWLTQAVIYFVTAGIIELPKLSFENNAVKLKISVKYG